MKVDSEQSDELLNDWRWLVPEAASPMLVTALGDVFVCDGEEQVLFLDVARARLTRVATSVEEFTLTAIPLSLIVAALVLKGLDYSINTMTLGGMTIAIGELVDDAIVDVENIFRRLRENARRPPAECRRPLADH